jgi:hypothetical protein
MTQPDQVFTIRLTAADQEYLWPVKTLTRLADYMPSLARDLHEAGCYPGTPSMEEIKQAGDIMRRLAAVVRLSQPKPRQKPQEPG